MMKRFFLFAITLFILNAVNAQWFTLNSGVTVDLNDIFFVDASTGYSVGGYGMIIKTTDGGITWQQKNSGTTNWLHSVFFTDASTGYTVGGGCYKTSDGGETWTEMITGITTSAMFSVYFVDANTGYAVGGAGTIIKTTDAGATWMIQNSGVGDELHGVHFFDENIGWAVGNYHILHTTDGGITWTHQYHLVIFHDCVATDSETCFASGTWGTIMKTTDGGTTWVPLSIGTSSDITGIKAVSSNKLYAVGGQGTIITTSDGGANWTPQASGLPYGILFSLFFADQNTGYIAGGSGIMLKTNNGGVVGLGRPISENAGWSTTPNPAREYFVLNVENLQPNCMVKISDITGRTIHERFLTETKTLFDVSSIPGGLYYLTLSNSTGAIQVRKIIIESGIKPR